MTSKDPKWIERDFAHVWHPYTRFSTLDEHRLPVIVRGEGTRLITDDGRSYLDAISSWWCAALGHGHPRIVEAIRKQAGELQHSILGNLTHPRAIEVAEQLAAMMPSSDRHVLFASDGASAVEQAVKIAVQYRHATGQPERCRFACFEDAYHGDTLGAMSLGYLEAFHRPFADMVFPALRLPFPHCLRQRNPAPCEGACFAAAERILSHHAGELTALVLEPLVQGAAGMRMYGHCFLEEAATWCRKHDVLLVVDEIATGFGRTGSWFAFEQAGVDPDIVCVGKALTGGALPASATICRDAIYRRFSDLDEDCTLQHGHTFCGNPLAMAAASAALEVYRELDAPALARKKGAWIREKLAPLADRDDVHDVRCLGMIGVVELGPSDMPAAAARAHRVRLNLMDRGILLRPLGNVIYVMPPLIIEEAELAVLLDHVTEAIATTA